jgi:hypothetical protein
MYNMFDSLYDGVLNWRDYHIMKNLPFRISVMTTCAWQAVLGVQDGTKSRAHGEAGADGGE